MRENNDPDVLLVSDFKGMATSGGEYGASPEYLSILTNANTEKDGTIQKRVGSRSIYALEVPTTDLNQVFQFSYYGRSWILHRHGKTIQIFSAFEDETGIYSVPFTLAGKSDVLVNATEKASIAIKAEGDYCHIFIATSSTQLISMTIVARDTYARDVTSSNAKADIGGFYTTANNDNSLLTIEGSQTVVNSSAISINGSGELSVDYASKPSELVDGARVVLFSCFWLRYCDANYYIGTQLHNKGLRLNTIPLDVNVEVPESLRTNYIYNEPIQELDIQSLFIYEDTTIAAANLPWAGNRNPATTTQWDFSNGSYKNEAGKLTTRTPAFVAFGGLNPNNISSQLNIVRLRSFLIGAFEAPRAGDITTYVDKAFRSTAFHRADANFVTDYTNEEPEYFSVASTATGSPGCSLDAVFEVIYIKAETGGAAVSNIPADISRDLKQITIGDGYIVPLYGYSVLARQKSGVFPNKVYVVGNRLLLSGNSNRILISQNDWNYRGFTVNNVQISSFNFSENSAYLLQVEQGGGNINAIRSVNGVLIVSTDENTYRITSTDRNSPPNATSAVISRLTNQIADEDTIEVVNNSVFMANTTGLYSLEYQSENDEGVVNELSLAVASIFRDYEANAINYSRTLDSILVSFVDTNKLLRYSLRSQTWSFVHVSVPYKLTLFKELDGYCFAVSRDDLTADKYLVNSWNNAVNTDLTGVSFLSAATIKANDKTIASESTDIGGEFATQPALVTLGNSNLQLVYNNRIKSRDGLPVVYVENVAGNVDKDIISGFTTKAHHNGKTGSSLRFRNINLILSGYGTCTLTVIPVGSQSSKDLIFHTVTIGTNGEVSINNKQTTPAPIGTEAVIRLSELGISESFSLAITFDDGLSVVGYQFDTGAKANRRLKG